MHLSSAALLSLTFSLLALCPSTTAIPTPDPQIFSPPLNGFCRINVLTTDPPLSRPDMHACLDAYNAGGWDGTVCAAHGWYKGGAAWRSAEDCYAACQPCVARAIEAGAPEVNCYTQIDFAGCWMGYNSGKN